MAVCSWLIVESPVTGCVSLTIDVVRLVARLGGFLARKGDGEPGVKTIWLGMQRILDFAAGIRFSRELQAQSTCV